MKDKANRKMVIYILFIVLILGVLCTNIFYDKMELLLFIRPDFEYSNETQVHFIDVGQGDSIAINLSNGKTMLIDTGTSQYEDKLTDYLDNIVLRGNNKIDYVILTHLDSDHSGNIMTIIDKYEIGTFYRPYIYEKYEGKSPYVSSSLLKNILNSLMLKGTDIRFSVDTESIVDGEISISWLYPYSDITEYPDTNSTSPVVIVEDNNLKLMLTGDIDSEVEEYVINNYSSDITDIDILKVAHHGSKYSTSAEFLQATTPTTAVFSVGENSYGHPSNEVLQRIMQYDEANSASLYDNIYTTLEKGNIIITLDASDPQFIDNIDKYSFIPYWVYEIVAIVVLLILMFVPNYKNFIKNYKYKARNKKYIKNKSKQK